MHPVTITGTRVNLREFRAEDLKDSMTVVGDPEVTQTLSFDARSGAEQAERLTNDIARASSDPRPDYYLAVASQADQLIGFVRIGLGRDHSGEIGYAIRRADWGKGYATEASSLLIDFGIHELGLHRIQAACGPDNRASQRLLTRLGFLPEGRIRDHVFTNGAWRDSILYSILDNEWRTPSLSAPQ